MADLEQAIYYILSQDSAVSSIVGTRIYPLKAPDKPTFPFIVYQRLNTTIQTTLDPNINPNFTIVNMWVNLFWAKVGTFSSLRNLSNAVKAALHMKRGTFNGVLIHGARLDNITDEYLDDVEIYRCMQTYEIMVNE